jgi:DNA-binding NarL/FixJ family response regulator
MDILPGHEDIVEFIDAGVSGFILQDATLDDLANTIRSVAQGLTFFLHRWRPRSFPRSPLRSSSIRLETPDSVRPRREREVTDHAEG